MNGQIITIVEGSVPEEKWQDLQNGFNYIISENIPEGILGSYIAQEKEEPTLWRLITIWKDFEAVKAMKQNHSVPPGVKIFKDIGIQPNVKIFEVKTDFKKLLTKQG